MELQLELRRRLRERIERGSLELPVLPEVASQVMAATAREECNAKELTDLLRRDQTLAGHLLRLANSPLYLPRTPIVSLQQAVSRLGMKLIRQLAIVISCQTRAFAVKGREERVRGLFRHSLAVAVLAQELARLRRLNVEDAFLCGLLHDVGRPVLLQAIVDLQVELSAPIANESVEGMLDEFHEGVGEALIRGWNLPARMGETIRFHHQPARADTAAAALLQLADDLGHLLLGSRAVEEKTIRAHPMLARLNVYPDELEQLLARREELTRMVEAVG